MTYPVYLFDLDGTLYDRDALVGELFAAQFDAFREELAGVDPQWYVARTLALDEHGYFPKEALYATLGGELELSRSLQQRLLEHFWDSYDAFCTLPDDTRVTLHALRERGARMGVVTNGRTERQLAKIDALGIREFFDTVVVSEAEGLKKPHPAIFARALQRCGATAATTAFVGDHPTADIEGARGAGLAAIWKRVPYWSMTRDDVRVVDRLADILD